MVSSHRISTNKNKVGSSFENFHKKGKYIMEQTQNTMVLSVKRTLHILNMKLRGYKLVQDRAPGSSDFDLDAMPGRMSRGNRVGALLPSWSWVKRTRRGLKSAPFPSEFETDAQKDW